MIREIIVAKNQRKGKPKKKKYIEVIGEDMRACGVNKSIVLRF